MLKDRIVNMPFGMVAGFFLSMNKKRSKLADIKWYLEGHITGGKRWLLPVDTYPFVIGRGTDCDLQISARHISKRHAEINEFGSTIMIHDLGSTNGTTINGTRIGEPVSLKPGDHVTIGGIELIVKTRADIKKDEQARTSLFEAKDHTGDFSAYYGLTRKEKEVLKLLSKGRSVKSIAEVLEISSGTAKNHIVEIYRKTGVHARYELVNLYSGFGEKS